MVPEQMCGAASVKFPSTGRTFDSQNDSGGINPPRTLSALPPIATELMRRNELTRCANSVLTHHSDMASPAEEQVCCGAIFQTGTLYFT